MEPDENKESSKTNTIQPKKPEKKKKKKKTPGSAKGIETMFRNAYRVQLDMLALTATKANIMISLNGVIVSILMVTGGFIYANTPIFLLPAILFLITSGISIYFALSAASPTPDPAHTRVFCCLRDVIKGKASLRDFKNYVILPEKGFDKESSNILIFSDFACLPKDTYLEYMKDLIEDQSKIYEKMSDQLYRMGLVADQKFNMLRYSYSVFRWGLIVSILVFLSLKVTQNYYPAVNPIPISSTSSSSILKFKSIYEPSGVQQLSDGRLIIIEDEPQRPFHILTPKSNGQMIENKSLEILLRIAFRTKLDDLEAITIGPDGFIYVSTSHKRNKKGERKKEREQLIRFKIEGTKIVNTGVITDLHDAIEQSGLLGKVDQEGKGGLYNLNIEAISFDIQQRLMICLRAPQIAGKSTILTIENPDSMFSKKEKPVISKSPILLDLNGGGIRAMSFDPRLDGYLITNDIFTSKNDNEKHSQVSFWDGNPDHQPNLIKLPGLINMSNVEGIAPVSINNEPRILLVSDNGDIKQNRPADYLYLEYHQLSDNKPN
jgi:hypothetical protein